MRKLLTIASALLISASMLAAQSEPDPASRFDDLAAYMNLTDSQLTCLKDNRAAFRDAAAPLAEELRAAQRKLRLATRKGEDTAAAKAEVDALVEQLESLRTTYVSSAAGCLDGAQQAQLAELEAAETLMREVKQGLGLLILEPTEERTRGLNARRRGPARR